MCKSITQAFMAYLNQLNDINVAKRDQIINSFMLQKHLATYDVRIMLETCFQAYLEMDFSERRKL